MRTIFSVLMVLSSLSPFAMNAHGRTWTDSQGNKTNAKFVRIHEGMVVLLRGNTPLRLPFESFSEEDQQYLREMMEAEGKGNLLPPPNAEGEDAATPTRTWTDRQGNRLVGRLIKVEGANAYLQVGAHAKPYPLNGFSPVDQEFIRNWMVRNPGAGMPAPNMPGTGSSRMTPDQVHAELVRRQQEAGKSGREQDESSPVPVHQHASSMTHGRGRDDGPGEQRRQREYDPAIIAQREAAERQNALLAERKAWKQYQTDPNAAIPRLAFSNCDRACCKCRHALPDYAQLGEKCPWCGSVWEAEFDCAGKMVNRKTATTGFGRFVQTCMGICIWIAVIWAVVVALRMVRSIGGGT